MAELEEWFSLLSGEELLIDTTNGISSGSTLLAMCDCGTSALSPANSFTSLWLANGLPNMY